LGVIVAANGASVIRFGVFELDLKNRELRRNGVLIDLQPQAFRILALLAARSRELVTRQEIQSELWPEERIADLDSRLNFEIKKIREALRDDAENPRYIETVRKSGYKFVSSTEVVSHIAGPNERTGGGERVEGSIRRSSKDEDLRTTGDNKPAALATGIAKSRWASVGLLLVVAGTLAGFVLWSRKAREVSGASVKVATDRNPRADTGVPFITSVTPILPQQLQTIVIKGRGLGSYGYFNKLDSPFLAIRDKSAGWAAGRIIAENADDITLSVSSWNDSEIIVTGFAGDYGKDTWLLHPYDRIEIAVWNPQNGEGPAVYDSTVEPNLISKGRGRSPVP